MADYGLRINKKNGDNIYDSSIITWLQVGQFEFPAMDADVRFETGQTYQVGDFVRTGSFLAGSPLGDRWERLNTPGGSDPNTDSTNWIDAEINILWDTSFPIGTQLTTMTQLIDTPPDEQEGYIPNVVVSTNNLRVQPFALQNSQRVIVIVLVKG